ncbi:hypothetical protein CesoFtcFv8_025829 [Champsocephalus esox]|uniref:Uncharacterized protein n=1 Tax=Champsocephalus esox TaxID=159716 RepID=A0AAN8B140_9TELE|nr:hypothetical protein CesoFtcFv8_025829 [Champsocephalus esox]
MSSFGEILKEIGEFGLFQKRLMAVLCIPRLFTAFDVIGQVFGVLVRTELPTSLQHRLDPGARTQPDGGTTKKSHPPTEQGWRL